MKKSLITVFALFTFSLCNAQLKTQSNYDVDGNGEVTIEDVTSTVHKVLGKASDDRNMVDGESLNALLLSIDARLKAIEEKLGISTPDTPEPTDPYNGHAYVDLGLPSGLKWATCNVGADKPEDYGDYFAWGATEPQELYDWVHTPYQTQNTTDWSDWSSTRYTKYLGSTSSSYKDASATDADALKTVLDPDDDVAHVKWGGEWRMPTIEELDELCTKCTWTWGSQNGVKGYTVVGPNGNSLFLPAAGYRYDSSSGIVGSNSYYWSSSLFPNLSYSAYLLSFDSGDVDWFGSNRFLGLSVRPVCP